MTDVRIINGRKEEVLSVSEVKARGLNRWSGWECSVGIHCLYIDFDGMVWRGPCRVGGPLGHMLSDWKLPFRPIASCTRNTCDCGTGIKLPKQERLDHLDEDDDTPHQMVMPVQRNPRFDVQWDLGRRCNFDCSYCWPDSHNKTDVWVPLDALKVVVDKVHDAINGYPAKFNFAGGEPTLHPDFIALCIHITSLGHEVHVQTNGTMSVNRARILSRLAEISISVHLEQVNDEKLLRNVGGILAENGKLEVKIMVAPDMFDRMREVRYLLKQVPGINRARLTVAPLRDPVTNELMDYTPEQVKEFGDVVV